MTGTNLQRKRSEHGASLILLVAIIGLAFIVTVGAFLLAASNAQNTARFASAKIDVANREDVLMREILRETAHGIMLNPTPPTPPDTWTNIMNRATGNLLAISYVDPQERDTVLAAAGITGKVTTANTGDTGGVNPLDIFKGYTGAPHSADLPWSEVPFGGTSGLAGCVPNLAVDPNNNVIDPPLMNWSGNMTLSSATATTTPQEFFLGSLNTAGTPPTQSNGNRWAQLTYPAIRFGYKQPGDKFIARRVWWRIPLEYSTTEQTQEDQAGIFRYKSAPVKYVLSVYEIPSQLPISGNAYLQIGNNDGTAWGSGITIAGSIYGGLIKLQGGTYNGVSSQQQVNITNGPTVGPNGGIVYPDSGFDLPGERENLAVQNPTAFPPGVAAPVSVAGNDGKVLMVPALPVNNLTGAQDPTGFYMQAPGNAPTHWDLYARPYYRCRVRVIINADSTVTIYYLPDTASPFPQPDRILGFPDPAPLVTFLPTFTTNFNNDPNSKYGINYANPTGNRNILIVNIPQLVYALGDPAQLYSIYIGNPPNPPDPLNNPGIAIANTHDLTTIIDSKGNQKPFLFSSGLSIVTNQTLYLLDSFNQVTPAGTSPLPTSIYAPQIRYGLSGINSQISPQVNTQISLTGQVAVVATPAPSPVPSPTPTINPLSFKSSDDKSFPSSNIAATLNETIDPTRLPPITALSLLFTIEKEHTN